MLAEDRKKQLDEIVKKMVSNKEKDETIQFVVDDFKKKYEFEQPEQKKESLLTKVGNVFGKGLDVASEITGVKSAVDLGLTAGKGFSYGVNRLMGKSSEEALKAVGEQPMTEIEKVTQEKGLKAGIKNIAGKSLEVGLSTLPFSEGGGAAIQFTGKLAQQFPTIARYAGYATQGAKYGAGFGTAKGLQTEDTMRGVVSDAIKGARNGALAGVIIPATVEGTVRAVKNVASLYSGVPKEALERAFNNPEIVGKAAREYSKNPEQTRQILDKANESFDLIKEQRGNAYAKALEKIQNSKTVKTINKTGVQKSIDDIIGKFNKKILSPGEVEKINEISDLVNNWDDFTPLGTEELKMAIRNRVNIGNSKQLNSIITKSENSLKSYIDKVSPEIAKMRAQYAKDSEFIDNLQREIFGSTSKMSDSTKLNRLLSVFSQKSDLRQKLVEELGKQTGTDLLNEITGAAMSSWLPTGWVQRFVLAGSGLSGIVNPVVISAAPAASPRIVGKAARVLGQAGRLTPIINKYGQPLLNKVINK